MLGLKETVVQIAKANGVRWYGHVLRRDDGQACFEKSIGVWSKGQEEVRTTKEDVEDASGEGEQECWFREGCLAWIQQYGEWEIERLLSEWGKSSHTLYGDKPGSKLDWLICIITLWSFGCM